MRRRRPKRLLIVTVALAFAAMFSVTIPSHALVCARQLDTACRVVFGTYCKVTRQNPCLP